MTELNLSDGRHTQRYWRIKLREQLLLVPHCTTQSELSKRQLPQWTMNKRYLHLRISGGSAYSKLTIHCTGFCALWPTDHIQELQKQLLSKQLGKDSLKIRQLNDRLMQAERAFTSREGIFKQEWYKHLVSRLLMHRAIRTFLSGRPILTASVTTHRCTDLHSRTTGTLLSIPV
jgi:hypothetical protein